MPGRMRSKVEGNAKTAELSSKVMAKLDKQLTEKQDLKTGFNIH